MSAFWRGFFYGLSGLWATPIGRRHDPETQFTVTSYGGVRVDLTGYFRSARWRRDAAAWRRLRAVLGG